MSNLTIGRVGIDLPVDSIRKIDHDGDRLSIQWQTVYGSLANAVVVSQQLNGYVDMADESFVPVTYAEMPDLDGFYRVLSASVERPEQSAFAGVFQCSVTLERVQSYSAPLIESVVSGKKRAQAAINLVANPSAEASAAGVVAIPGTNGGGSAGAAVTNPVVTTSYGTRVFRATWSTVTTVIGNSGMYWDVPVVAGRRYSFAANYVRSSITQRLRIRVQWRDAGADIALGGATTSVVLAAGVVDSSTFRVENILAPFGALFARVIVEVIAGVSAQNWSVGSYLEVDGLMANVGSRAQNYLLTDPAWWQVGLPALAVPGQAVSMAITAKGSGVVAVPYGDTIPVASGTVRKYLGTVGDEFTAQFSVSPAVFYEGAATLTMGDPLRVVSGRQIRNDPTRWLLSNGLIEVRPSFASAFTLEVRRYTGTWSAWFPFTLDSSGIGALMGAPAAIAVLSNTPERVTIRLMAQALVGFGVTYSVAPVTVDLTIRRGMPHVAVEAQGTGLVLNNPAFSTAVLQRRSYHQAANNLWVASPTDFGGTPAALTPDIGASSRWSFAIGFGDPDVNTIGDTSLDEYMWAGSGVMGAVAR